MKALALLLIAGAFSLYGSAFFGVWTAPGLENLPTFAVVMEHTPWGDETPAEPESGIFPITDAHQILPHGVTADWGDVPVILMPERNTGADGSRPATRTAATARPTTKAAARRTTARPKSKAPKVAALSDSYPWHAKKTSANPVRPWYEPKRSTASSRPWYATGETAKPTTNWYVGRQMQTRHRVNGTSSSRTVGTHSSGRIRVPSIRAPRF